MKKFQSTENLSKINIGYCWISISCTLPNQLWPPHLMKENLELIVETKAKSIGLLSSIKLKYIEKHKAYQWCINFLTEDATTKAVKLFNELKLPDLEIKSEYRDRPDQKQNNPLISANNQVSISNTYVCWISITCKIKNAVLPPNLTKDHLEEFFLVESKNKIGQFHSINLKYVEKYTNHQCFINFLTKEAAEKAVDYFGNYKSPNMIDFELKSEYRESESEKKGNDLKTYSNNNPLQQNQPIVQRQRENSKPREQNENSKRYIVIDGNNVAIHQGRNENFDPKGIQLVVEYFQKRGHEKIVAFVPKFREANFTGKHATINQNILDDLYKKRFIEYTPSMSYDDGFILEFAKEKDAIIVSNDRYNDKIFEEKYAEQKRNLVTFTLFDNVFIPSYDPYGRNGPKLDQLLENSKISVQNLDLKNGHKPIIKNSPLTKTRPPLPSMNQEKESKNLFLVGQNNVKKMDPYSIFDVDDNDDTVTRKIPSIKKNERKNSVVTNGEDEEDDSDKESIFSYADNIDDEDEHSDSNIDIESPKTKSEEGFYRAINLKNGKKFMRFFQGKTMSLADKSTIFISVDNAPKNGGKYCFNNLVIRINSKNKDKFDKAVAIISKWRVVTKKITFEKEEFTQLMRSKNEIINLSQRLANKREVYLYFNTIKFEILIMVAEQTKGLKIFREIEELCSSRIDSNKKLRISDDVEYEFLTRCLNIKEFKRKYNLESMKIEPFKRNLGGEISFKGKRNQLNKINFFRLQQIFTVFEDGFVIKDTRDVKSNAPILTFVAKRLENFKRDLIKEFFVHLEFEIKECQNSGHSDWCVYFKIAGFEQFHIEKLKNDLVEEFLKGATSKVIHLDDRNDISQVEKVVNEFKRSLSSTNEVDSEYSDDVENSSFKFFVNTEIVFNGKLKKIFLNGTNVDDIDEIKNDLEEKIGGSKKCTESKRYSSFIFNCLMRDKCIDKQLKTKYKDVRFSINYNQNSIRLSGLNDQVVNVSKELDNICSKISERIITKSFELKKSELSYLQTRESDLMTLEKATNSLIKLNPFVRFSLVKMDNNINIELIHGDMTKLNMNAYINPANKDLKHMGGLAKAISRSAGKQMDQECNKYIENHGQIEDGEVFVSNAGFLGCLSNSIIVHAVGPIWHGGMKKEELSLRNVMKKSLESIDLKFLNSNSLVSVAIPPISTGIFNYPIAQATTIITEAVIEYLQITPNSKIKDIKFISNEEATVKEWTQVLSEVSVKKSLQLNASVITSSTNKTTNAKWYWKDDQGLWKQYISKYLNFIQSNFEKKNFQFDLEMIERGCSYKIDLIKKTQTNKTTSFVHEITDSLPMAHQAQWCWRDDEKNHSPYSLLHSDQIETAYLNGQASVEFTIKRHDNDQDDTYRIIFCERDATARKIASEIDQSALAIQHNLRTGYNKRVVYRETSLIPALVINEEISSSIDSKKPISQIYALASSQDKIEIIETTLKKIIQKGYVKEKVNFLDLSSEKIQELQSEYDAVIVKGDENLIITALKEKAIQLKSVLLEMAVEGSKFIYPREWSHMDSSCNFKIVEIDKQSEEFNKINKHFKQTLPNATIIKIERMQNKWLWKLYSKSLALLKEKSNDENERYLFHGTRSNEPKNIYGSENSKSKGEVGFDMRYSNQGMWGIGIYFAENASYSNGYAYKNDNGSSSFFYARVAIGQSIQVPNDNKIRMPPLKSNQESYDSIQGFTGNSNIFIIYENSRAYPEYLIRFQA